MRIGFIGAGRVGNAFGAYLKKNGMELSGYYSIPKESAENAASLTESGYYSSMIELVDASDVVFITTPDAVIEEVAHDLAHEISESGSEGLKSSMNHKMFVHMSGAHSSQRLEILQGLGSEIGSLHPVQSIADVETAVNQLQSTVFSVEGSSVAVEKLSQLMEQMDNTYFIIKSEQKTLYHMAACTVSNYLVTLVDVGLAMYESIGIDRQVAYKALYPLIRGTVENLKHMDTKEALTGPIARGDINTVKAHLDAVTDENIEAFYRYLGNATVQMAKAKSGTNQDKLGKLEELLNDEVKS